MKFSYYPGCSLERNAAAYNTSTMAIAGPLGLEFDEIDDWNCCGATEYTSINLLAAYALIARNLALAEQMPDDGRLVAPCSACFLNLTKVAHHLEEEEDLAEKVNLALAEGKLHYTPGSIQVYHLLEIIYNDVGLEKLASKVVKPLRGLRIAPYYGCMIVRPGYQRPFDNPEYPTSLDKIVSTLGANVVDFPMKANCCGGHMTQISQPVALEMLRRLLKNAADYNADMIVTLCPMCQLNLDAYQDNVNSYFKTDYHIPILYFTQLIGIAMGIPADQLGIGKELVDARPALAKIGVEVPEEAVPAGRKKPPKEALPMPTMSKEVDND
jgi:heterodisulfide reductase subunit B